MFNHALKDYKCPICLGINGVENDDTLIRQSDIVYKDNFVMVYISSFFIGNNQGHVVIVPTKHFENIYDLSQEYAAKIQEMAQKISIVLKEAYKCGGITLLQNNEPVGGQHAFHYHLHVFPRYENDNLHKKMMDKKNTTKEERKPFVDKIKAELNKD